MVLIISSLRFVKLVALTCDEAILQRAVDIFTLRVVVPRSSPQFDDQIMFVCVVPISLVFDGAISQYLGGTGCPVLPL